MPGGPAATAPVLTLGGTTDTATGAPGAAANKIIVVTEATDATGPITGAITVGGTGTLRLRAATIAVGQKTGGANAAPGFLNAVDGQSKATIDSQFQARPGSALYLATPRYVPPGATYLTANRLELTVGEWALLQNTDTQTAPAGGSLIGSIAVFRGGTGDPTVGIFGSLNGKTGVTAAVQTTAISLNGIPATSVRINGCVALQGSGCIANPVDIPNPQLNNPAGSLLLSIAPTLAIPVDLVTGATNEALWRDDPAPTVESDQ